MSSPSLFCSLLLCIFKFLFLFTAVQVTVFLDCWEREKQRSLLHNIASAVQSWRDDRSVLGDDIICQRKSKQMNGGWGGLFYRPGIPRGLVTLSTMPTIPAVSLPIPFTTEQFIVNQHRAFPLHVVQRISPGFILTTISAQKSRHAPRHCWFFCKWTEVERKRREREWWEHSFQFLKRERTATFLP